MKKMKDIDPELFRIYMENAIDADPEALCGETAEEIWETSGKYSFPEGTPNPFKGDELIFDPHQWCIENAEKLGLIVVQSD